MAAASISAPSVLAQAVLEEITVTAQKREDNVQSVGASLSVLDEQMLDSLALFSLPETAAYISNVQLFEDFGGAGIPTWVIRGVGLQDFNTNNTPTAAVYLDEVYQTSVVMGGVSLFDLEQVEVLRGPQGGLYGRNTSGGAVLVNTRRPVLGERSGYLDLGYGRWDTRRLEGALNLPLGESAALRVAGNAVNSGDAWQKSLVDNRSHGKSDLWNLRSWLSYESAGGTEVEWKIHGGRDDSEIMLGRSIGFYAPDGGYCEAALQGRRDDFNCLNFAGLNRLSQGQEPSLVAAQADDGSTSLSDPINRQDNGYLGTSLILGTDLGFARFVSLSSFDWFDYGVALDLDASTGEYAHRFSSSDIEVLSQEFRLVSTGAGPLEWLAGLVLNEERFEERRDFLLRENILVGLGRGRLNYDQDTSSQALYGDLRFALTDALFLHGSLRYTREDKSYRNGEFFIPGASPFHFVRDLAADYQLEDNWSGRIGLDWQQAEALLLYATISSGFKSGGFYGGFTFSPLEVLPYGEETIVALEAGFKSDWPDRALRLNGAVFHYDYRDVQGFLREINPVTGTGIDRLGNQGNAEHQGAELQLSWMPVEALGLDVELGYLDAVFLDSGVQTRNIEDEYVVIRGTRPYAPRWSASARTFLTAPLGSYRSRTTLGYQYRSEFSGRLTSAVDAAVNRLPGYGVMDLSIEVMPASEDWSVSVWVKNLLDRHYRTRVKSDGLMSYIDLFGEPRNLGLSIRMFW